MRSEVWLYGSVARWTHTEHSDLDVLVLPRGQTTISLDQLTRGLPQQEFLSVTTYSWHEIDRMADYGSLFLVHLATEGQLLHGAGPGAGLRGVLDTLPAYTRHRRELRGFAMALEDGVESLGDGGDIRYELGIVGRVIRHASILACYLQGDPKFDRESSISSAFSAMGMSNEQLELALALASEIRRRDGEPYAQLPTPQAALGLFELAQTFLRRVAAAHGAA